MRHRQNTCYKRTRITDLEKNLILDDWQTGRFSHEELAVKYQRAFQSIRNIIKAFEQRAA